MRGDSGYAYMPAGQAEVEFGKYEERIKQLERLNATLAAEIDRMRPVVERAQAWAKMSYGEVDMVIIKENKLRDAVDAYESSKR